jgi:hypothetical protein
MKLLFNIGVILFVFSFLFECSFFGYQSPRYVKLAHEITEKVAKELKAQKNLYLIGTGGRMMDDIQMMAMSFNYYQEVNLEQARKLLIYVINEYISDINNDQDVRPYLHEYPFTSKNVEIRIFIYGPDRRKLPPEKIGYISSIDGVLEYYTRADDDHPICRETYAEALSEIAFSQELEMGFIMQPTGVVFSGSRPCTFFGRRYRNQLQILEPHLNANFWDHEFLSPTFAQSIQYHITNYLKDCGGSK